MSRFTPQEVQLAEIRVKIDEHRKDAAESRRSASEHLVEAGTAEELARRWEVVHDAIRFGTVPNLDGCRGPETGEVPW